MPARHTAPVGVPVEASGTRVRPRQRGFLLEHIGDGFVRYRLGIGPKSPPEIDLKDYVLGTFTPEQHTLIQQKLDHFVSGLERLLDRGPEQAMNELNRKDPP